LVIREQQNSDPPITISEIPPNGGMTASGIHDEDPFRRIIQFLKKRSWIVVVSVLLGFLGGVLVNRMSRRLFTAQANIEVEAEDISSQFRIEQMQGLSGGEDTSEKLDTEMEILRSRNLAMETIKELRLYGNPDFIHLENGKPWDVSKPSNRELLIADFEANLKISRLGHTDIIQIFATNRNPELASMIANTLISRYIEHSFRENYAATEKISSWLNDKLSGMKADLEKSQARILDLQKDIGVYGMNSSNSIVAANLEELNKQYADAEVDRLLKESRLQEIQTSSPDVIDAALGTADPVIETGRARLAQLNSDYTSLIQTYGPEYPKVKTLKAQITQLEKELRQEDKVQVDRARKEFDAAGSNEAKLLAALKKQEQDVYGLGQKAVEYELARRDYETNRLLYDGLQQRLQEAGIMAGLHSTAIHTIDSADIPVVPSRPRHRFNNGVGAALGFIIGVCIALLLEAMDTNLKTMNEIEQALQLPLLAAIPQVDAENLLPAKFKEHAVTPGTSTWSKVAESLRGMRTSILLSSPGAPPKVIMVASTRPAEGKSSVAGLTAITFALNGAKVLLIDADLRRPAIHLRFRMGKGLGLSSVLSGKATLEEAVEAWPDLPNVHILTSGPVPPLPSELLSSNQMEDLLTRARAEYDFVFLDTPPVLAVTDASVLGRLADATILIIRYNAAQKQVVRRCIDLLERSGAHLLGVAVNAVDFTAPEYSDYYGRKYYEYYGERNPE
jgi:capsular exopolysaccharide synthesis family protein